MLVDVEPRLDWWLELHRQMVTDSDPRMHPAHLPLFRVGVWGHVCRVPDGAAELSLNLQKNTVGGLRHLGLTRTYRGIR
jgi:hypothetical protein